MERGGHDASGSKDALILYPDLMPYGVRMTIDVANLSSAS